MGSKEPKTEFTWNSASAYALPGAQALPPAPSLAEQPGRLRFIPLVSAIGRKAYSLPDVLVLLYVTCIAREYLWFLNGGWTKNSIAWSLSTVIGLAIVHFLADKPEDSKAARWQLDWQWLAIVVLPLLCFFFLRAPFPFLEFDFLNYHFVNAERALRGWPMRVGEFFPGTLLPNPAPDMVFGIARYSLGYRLAPLLNVGCLLWTGALIDQCLRTFVRTRSLRYLAVLLILSTEPILAIVNSPMIDLYALPLLLASLLLIIKLPETRDLDRTLIKVSAFLGISLSFKLTNLVFILPLIGLLLYQLRVISIRLKYLPARTTLLLTAGCFILPSALFFGYMYHLTGNPVFPYYNNIFRSPLIAAANFKDLTMGPRSVLEMLYWPFSGFLHPNRLFINSNDSWYAGRLTLGVVIAIAVLLMKKTPLAIKQTSITLLCATWLWAFSSGIIRYANFVEILSGMLCVYMFCRAFRKGASLHARRADKVRNQLVAVLLTFLLTFQVCASAWYGLTYYYCFHGKQICEGIMQPQPFNRYTRPTLDGIDLTMRAVYDPRKTATYFQEAAYMFRDQNAEDFLTREDREQFRDVKLWINTYDGTSGYMSIAAPQAPIISVAKFLDIFDYMKSPETLSMVRGMINGHRGEKMYTLIQEYHFDQACAALDRVPMGFHYGKVQNVSLPAFSPGYRMDLLLVEIVLDER